MRKELVKRREIQHSNGNKTKTHREIERESRSIRVGTATKRQAKETAEKAKKKRNKHDQTIQRTRSSQKYIFVSLCMFFFSLC